jgi:hypothetical protein
MEVSTQMLSASRYCPWHDSTPHELPRHVPEPASETSLTVVIKVLPATAAVKPLVRMHALSPEDASARLIQSNPSLRTHSALVLLDYLLRF